jgi:hypothetical protein
LKLFQWNADFYHLPSQDLFYIVECAKVKIMTASVASNLNSKISNFDIKEKSFSIKNFEPKTEILLSQAELGTKTTETKQKARPFDYLGALQPDALVYTNAAINNWMRSNKTMNKVLLSPSGTRSFLLVNPETKIITNYIGQSGNTVRLGNFKFYRVEGIKYKLGIFGSLDEVAREDGMGYAKPIGQEGKKITFFINVRGGNTNNLQAALTKNGVLSVNMGFFGSPMVLERFAKALPNAKLNVKSVKLELKEILLGLLRGVSVGGGELGLAWRSTLSRNAKTQKLEVTISGSVFPLDELMAAFQSVPTKGVPAANYGSASVARVNNEADYIKGANPFELVDRTRKNGAYVKSDDPVANIAADIHTLQEDLLGRGAKHVRKTAQVRSFLSYAIDRRDRPNVNDAPLSATTKAKLNAVLVGLGRYGIDFESAQIKQASARAVTLQGKVSLAIGSERQFVRNVFLGGYRRAEDATPPAEEDSFTVAVNTALNLAAGLNRAAGVVIEVARAEPTISGQDEKQLIALHGNTFNKFAALVNTVGGGALNALGLMVPAGVDRQVYENEVAYLLGQAMRRRLMTRGGTYEADAYDADAMFKEFRSSKMTPGERWAIAASIRRELKWDLQGLTEIDGLDIVGEPARLGWVGGKMVNSNSAQQGVLMWGRTPSGRLVFWLQGRTLNRTLRDANNQLLTNQADAIARAKALIKSGEMASALWPLKSR